MRWTERNIVIQRPDLLNQISKFVRIFRLMFNAISPLKNYGAISDGSLDIFYGRKALGIKKGWKRTCRSFAIGGLIRNLA